MHILVIGAGVAGLTAARRLAARGHSIVVLDKGQGPGGRVATRRIMAAGDILQFDHGAQYLTARGSRFIEEVAGWAGAGIVRPWRGRLASFDSEGRETVEDGIMRWVGVPRMSTVGRHLAEGLDVRPSTRVRRLGRAAPRDGWTATTGTGEVLGPFDAAVVAVPAPEAAQLLDDAPALAAQAAVVSMRPCWAALVAFDEPVRARFDGAFVLHSPLGWIARDGSKPKRGRAETWVLHASATWTAAHVEVQADAVGPFLLHAFADLVPARLPLPVHLSVHRWRYAVADPPLARGAFADACLGLAVCGDWCLGTRIESAFLSGLAAAEAIG